MSVTTSAMGSFYDEKRAASELRKYREKGPIPSTRALIEALRAEGIEGATLLDIGSGIGAIQHDLLDAGVSVRHGDQARQRADHRLLDVPLRLKARRAGDPTPPQDRRRFRSLRAVCGAFVPLRGPNRRRWVRAAAAAVPDQLGPQLR